jgi:hypothetical protein
VKASTREKQKVISANSSSNLSTNYSAQYGSQNKIIPVATPVVANTNSNSFGGLHSPSISPERKRFLFPPNSQQNHPHTTTNQNGSGSNSNNRSDSCDQKRPNQIENVIKWHQFLMFYHYNCVELLINYQTIADFTPTKPETYCRLLLSLSLLIKNRNTLCLSMIANHSKYLIHLYIEPKKMLNSCTKQ